MPTIKEAIEFIHLKKGLKDWTHWQIVYCIHRAIKECAFTFTLDKNGKLDGLFIGYWNEPCVSIHSTYFAGNYKHFVKYLKNVFPTCKEITAERFGKFVSYKLK